MTFTTHPPNLHWGRDGLRPWTTIFLDAAADMQRSRDRLGNALRNNRLRGAAGATALTS